MAKLLKTYAGEKDSLFIVMATSSDSKTKYQSIEEWKQIFISHCPIQSQFKGNQKPCFKTWNTEAVKGKHRNIASGHRYTDISKNFLHRILIVEEIRPIIWQMTLITWNSKASARWKKLSPEWTDSRDHGRKSLSTLLYKRD